VDHDHLKELSWNEENRLTAVVEGGGRHVTSFLYDAAGQRVVKQGRGGDSITIGQFFNLKGKIAATKHVFVGETRLASKLLPPPGWDQGLVPATTTSSAGTTTGTTPPLPGCDPSSDSPNKCPLPGAPPVAYGVDTTTVRPETYYYHADHLGSTSWVTDQNGKVHEHVEYYPYGEAWWEPKYDRDGAGVKGQQFLFTSKELDEETGLYYFGARYFDPKRARWESVDPVISVPIGNLDHSSGRLYEGGGERSEADWVVAWPAMLSRYSYVLNNPSKYVDPDGRTPKGAATGAVWGAAVGTVVGFIAGGGGGTGVAVGTGGAGILAIPAGAVQGAAWGAAAGTALGVSVGNWVSDALASASLATMLGASGTQVTSQTVWGDQSSGSRVDVENPNPGQRPGQIHFQQGKEKYIYDTVAKVFREAPKRVNDLLKSPAVQRGLEKAMKILGETK
jgi:RHS repeat-associated protein